MEKNSGYKETKIGWIPEDWISHHLGEIGTFSKGKGISKSDIIETGIPCVLYGDLYTKHKDYIKSFTNFIDSNTADKSYKIEEGDLLFAGSGETAEEIGMCAAYLDNSEAYAGGDIIIFKPNDCDSKFLGYLMNHELVRRQKYSLAQGYSVVHIYASQLKSVVIPLPNITEQKKIAEILSTWDESIQKTEALIREKEKLKKGLMQQLLTGKWRLPGFSGDWQVVRFKDIVKVDSKSLSSKTNPDFTFNYISLSDVDNGKINSTLETYTFNEAPSRARRIVNEGDILMATVRPSLKSFAMVNREHEGQIASTGFAVITPKSGFNAKYLYHYLFSHHIASQFHALTVGSNYPAINSSEVKKLKVKIPPSKEETDSIESILSSLNREVSYLKMSCDALENQKKGLMQQILTGKTRVKVT